MSYLIRTFIIIYQKCISPYMMPRCRYVPTCSSYMLEAVETFGPYRGLVKGVKRMLTCHPFGGSGYDPLIKEPIK